MIAYVKYTGEQRRLLRNSRCLSAGSDSIYLQFKFTRANTPTALPRFMNVIFRHHYVMQKSSRCIEIEQATLPLQSASPSTAKI